MVKRYYVSISEARDLITRITLRQVKANCFVNIAVKPYKGKKYDPIQTVVIVVG